MATIVGTAIAELLNGTAAADEISGLGGDDTLNGGLGKDTLTGGAGNDVYLIDATDVLIEAPGGGIDTILAAFSYTLLANFENLTLTGSAAINGTGNALNNVITGNAGANVLSGGAGSDTMIGGGGNDTYIVAAPGDVVTEALNQGTDTVQASVTEVLAANVEKLILTGLASVSGTGNSLNNTLTGNNGINSLNGGAGNDTVSGGGGADTLIGGTGDDTLVWDAADVKVDGGANTDTLRVDGATALNLAAVSDTKIVNVEVINLAGANTLTLAATDALAISSTTNTLRINGGAGDAVSTLDSGWAPAAQVTSSGQTYATYTKGGATLQVDTDVDRSGIMRIELSDMSGANGFRLSGAAPGDRSGWSVSGAGDVNGDGFDDVIVGAPYAGPNGTASGASYVVFGGPGGFPANLDLSGLNGTNGFKLSGVASGEQSGWSVSGAGDVNGDGLADVILGAPLTDAFTPPSTTVVDVGAIHVVFGADTFSSNLNISALNGTNGFELINSTAASSGRMGSSVDNAGDVNGDGFDDLLMGSPRTNVLNVNPSAGQAIVQFGAASGFVASTSLLLNGQSGFRLRGEAASDYAGISMSSAGDLNGDGYDDIVIGAMGAPYGEYTGAVYVLFGKASGFAGTIEASAINGTNGFQLSGAAPSDHAGYSVSGAGDVNGDGYGDLVIGARYADAGGANSGAAYVVFGKADGYAPDVALSALDGSDGFRLSGGAAGDNAGHSVSAAGDVNGDGLDDLIIGAWRADPNGANSGAAYVVFGKAGGFAADIDLGELNGSAGIRIEGAAAGDNAGWSVSGAGDVNGDGFGDLIVGARYADPGGNASGASYVVFGSDINGVVTHAGTAGANTLTGTGGADVIVAGNGADTITAGGGADAVHAGAGDDVITVGDLSFRLVDGGGGEDQLGITGAGIMLDLTQLVSGRIAGIEALDITGSGDNALRLTVSDLHDLSATGNILRVDGDGGDRVTTADGGWVLAQNVVIGPQTYAEYTNGTATLRVDVDMERVIVRSSIALSELDGANGFRITGEADGDYAGRSVSSAGDVNDDGFDDLLVGADHFDNGVGAAYVVFGAEAGFGSSLALSSLDGTNGFRITGEGVHHYAGRSVSGAGDVNGDGIADVIVGAPHNGAFAGTAYVVFGTASGYALNLDASALDGTNGFRIHGETLSDSAGRAVSSAGDVNGDGVDDLLVGAPGLSVGKAHVVFGAADGFASDFGVTALDGTNGFTVAGEGPGDHAGISVSSAGDVDGDGYDDLLVGASGYGDNSTGAAYVVFGDDSGFLSSLQLSALNGANGFQLTGNIFDFAGISVSSAGDVNGDGYADFLVGTVGFLGNNGAAYVVFGTASGFASNLSLSALDGENGFRVTGSQSEGAGISVSAAGDVDGDGYDDVVVGAYDLGSGGAYVVYGAGGGFASTLSLSALDGINGFRVTGDYSGYSVSSAGDVNGDGFADLLVGAYGYDGSTGAAYVLFGGNFRGEVDFEGTAGADTLDGAGAPEIFVAGGGNDLLIGSGGADVFRAGAGSDRIEIADDDFADVDGGSGEDTLVLAGSGFELDLTALANSRISGIETVDLVAGSLSNTLTLAAGDLLDLSDTTNTLTVEGGDGDIVNLDGSWVNGGEIFTGYITYTQGTATILVGTEIAVNFI